MKILFTTLLISITGLGFSQTFNAAEIQKHIEYLASDKLAGREPGTKGEKQAYMYIQKEFKKYGLTPKGSKGYLQPFAYKTMLSPHDTIAKGKKKNGTNVIGFLDNGAAKTIVIGGHFDHLGNHEHSSSLDKDKKLIHNGADDNASGTAGVLALAKYFTTNNITEKCNFLFMCYSAEEDGLIGSKYFTNNPTYDLANVSCMLNMDMIGRLNDSTKKVTIFGVGTSPAYTNIFATIHTELKMGYDSSGIGPSDQTSFYLKNIPVLHFFSGQHSDYHKSSDDASKINYKGEVAILEIMKQVAEQLANLPSVPFTATKQPEQARVSFKVTLGIMPDYSFEGKGVKVDAVTEGKPAQLGGILGGDIVTKMGDVTIHNIYDYMKALSLFKKGEEASIEILRNEKPMSLKVVF
ncbi:MAG: M20/M25/M40 family metallo-hydrolase [Bacteroidota bacterium]